MWEIVGAACTCSPRRPVPPHRCAALAQEMSREVYEIVIQAVVDSKVVARETLKATRKNVTAKCYGGDVTRKKKLLEKQ